MTTQALSKPVPIHDFVAELRKFPEPAFDRVDQIIRFLQNTPVVPDTLAPYLTWDKQHYTRNLIDKTPLYELVAICWEVGQTSSVHNHREQNCWMAVPVGRLRVENFHVVAQNLDAGTCHLETADTVEMNPRPALCRRSPGAGSPRLQSPRVRPARGKSARVFPSLRHLRRLFKGTRHLRRDQAALSNRIRKAGKRPRSQRTELRTRN